MNKEIRYFKLKNGNISNQYYVENGIAEGEHISYDHWGKSLAFTHSLDLNSKKIKLLFSLTQAKINDDEKRISLFL
ncbi:MAG: hypothetical protein HC836_37245 [Richelia sp. RM2_1_2]|nr:hypothetical protein [Richelia sp. RM2_1_2]